MIKMIKIYTNLLYYCKIIDNFIINSSYLMHDNKYINKQNI